MTDLRLRAELWLRLHGWWIPILVLLGVAAAALHAVALPDQQRRIASTASHLDGEKQALAEQTRHHADALASRQAAPAPQDGVSRFDRQLVGTSERSHLIRTLWREANRQQVRLGKIDFREERDVAGGFVRLRIHVPASGTYPAVKRLAFGLMHNHPSLALDAIEFKRDRPEGTLESELQFTFLMRP